MPDVGVGRRGRSATFLEVNLDLVGNDQVGIVPLCFGRGALSPNGTVAEILESSAEFVTQVGHREAGDRVYFDAVPGLATTLARLHGDTSADGLAQAYSQTMAVLFRLLFIAYGEDKDLLPYRSNGLYEESSVTKLAHRLSDQRINGDEFESDSTALWEQFQTLCDAIRDGRPEWDVPAYGGTLFSADRDFSGAGLVESYTLTDDQIGPTLSAFLQIQMLTVSLDQWIFEAFRCESSAPFMKGCSSQNFLSPHMTSP